MAVLGPHARLESTALLGSFKNRLVMNADGAGQYLKVFQSRHPYRFTQNRELLAHLNDLLRHLEQVKEHLESATLFVPAYRASLGMPSLEKLAGEHFSDRTVWLLSDFESGAHGILKAVRGFNREYAREKGRHGYPKELEGVSWAEWDRYKKEGLDRAKYFAEGILDEIQRKERLFDARKTLRPLFRIHSGHFHVSEQPFPMAGNPSLFGNALQSLYNVALQQNHTREADGVTFQLRRKGRSAHFLWKVEGTKKPEYPKDPDVLEVKKVLEAELAQEIEAGRVLTERWGGKLEIKDGKNRVLIRLRMPLKIGNERRTISGGSAFCR